ncbi:MAG: gamma-glutamyltransferase family protein [Armatimonadetes bacterium]|nr:gamma-glutamyltransferase family protein [Armatimonadota bacterium]
MRGVVASVEGPAADAGAQMLRRGGNAMDAAIATAFAQCVTNPLMCGIGGMGVMTAHDAATGETLCIGFWGMAGSLARPDTFTADLVETPRGRRVRGERNAMGYQSVMTPGFIRGMADGFRRFGSGRIAWKDLLMPAVRLAHEGFVVDRYIRRWWDLDPWITGDPPAEERMRVTADAARIYLKDGHLYDVGDRLVQEDYARTIERLADAGPDDFYEGQIGKVIAGDMAAHGGLFTADDLHRYRPLCGEPLWGTFQDLTIAADGPPGSGLLVIQILNILEGIDLRALGWNSPRYLDVVARAMRHAFAGRFVYNADPRFTPVPLDMLLSQERAADVRRQILEGRDVPAPPAPAPFRGEGTTHVSVIDGDGNAVAMTHSTRESSGVVPPGLGFTLNNDMASFDPVPGRRNSIGPGKIPVTGGAPTLVFKDGQAHMALGSPGGGPKVNGIVQVILNVHVFGMSIEEAVRAERIHCDSEPVMVEESTPDEKMEALRRLGHRVERWPYAARMAAVLRNPKTGRLEGASDHRGGAGLAVVE